MNALEVHSVTKQFGGITAVRACSFTVPRGQLLSLIGPNGAGKTTLFNLVSGFLEPDSGSVTLNGTNVTHTPAYQRAACGLSRTFQAVRLFPEMTVLENLLCASKHTRASVAAALLHLPEWQSTERADTRRARELLALVKLSDKERACVKDLSYGQRKLVEILRALMTEPEILLLDEPAAGVNRTTLQEILKLIRTLHTQGKTVVIIEHDMHVVMNLSERVIVLDYGELIADGDPASVQSNPRVLEAYLGKKLAKK